MPNFKAHITVSTLGSAALVAGGTALYGWDGAIPTLAFVSGAAGGMVPDLDCNTSRPRRLAVTLTGLAAAVALAGFVTASGAFLNRPWGLWPTLAAAGTAFVLVEALARFVLARYTRHRGLFHSLAVPFIYGGLWACLAAPYGVDASMAVWLAGIFGVLSHLVLDAARGLSLNPLKLATADIGASTRVWLATTAVTLAAFARLTKI